MAEITIERVSIHDIRFPTRDQIGDAMNLDPDYSAAYCILHTNSPVGEDVPGGAESEGAILEGHGLAFTIGRGNELVCAGIRALADSCVVGMSFSAFVENPGAFWEKMVMGDSQLRWVGPEKGVIHLAAAALVNSLWDLWGKVEKKPIWKLFNDLSAAEKVRCISFKGIRDVMTEEEALSIFEAAEEGMEERLEFLKSKGLPAYVTSAGWLGLPDDTMRRLVKEAVEDMGMSHIKIKVGRDMDDDIRRCSIVRELIGEDRELMVDANQVWEVPEAIEWMKRLAEFRPLWIEEPVAPDDVVGHKAVKDAMAPLGIGVATGEHCPNRIIFKNFLQMDAIDFVQIDSTRLSGVNEVLAVLLLAKKFNKPVCPHAGGVGLCEFVNHLSTINYLCVSPSLDKVVVEFVDHLHEHFFDPCTIKDGRYVLPSQPGYSATMKRSTIHDYTFPTGPKWTTTTP